MPSRIVTLTTDFGTSDHFTGVLKGVILGIAPTARIVDITHEIGPYQIPEGGFVIAQAYRYFPRGTVHVVVVDPGVGTSRRPLVTEAAGQYFVAPDNGVLSMIYAAGKYKVRAVTASRYFLENVSRTFHGRDVFAPVAAHIAAGVPASRMGKPVEDYLNLDFYTPVRTARRAWTGIILKIDRFGNLVTNFRASEFPQISERPFSMQVGLERVTRLARTYAEAGFGELFLIEGSSGYYEVSENQASAARRLGCAVGAPVELSAF